MGGSKPDSNRDREIVVDWLPNESNHRIPCDSAMRNANIRIIEKRRERRERREKRERRKRRERREEK
jgi:hypothetical protein